MTLRLIKVRVLANSGRYSEALENASTIDVEALGSEDKMNYYDAMRTIYWQIGDDKEISKYTDLYFDVYLEYYNGGAGGD